MKINIKTSLGVLVAGFFLYLVLRQINIDQVWRTLSQAGLFFVITAIGSFFIGYSCRIERWRLMLAGDNPSLRWHQVTGPFLASIATNNVLPLRAGDIMRGFAFNNSLSISSATAITSLLIERLLDLLMVLGFLGLALWGLEISSSEFIGLSSIFLISSAILIGLVLFFPIVFKSIFLSIGSFFEKLYPQFGKKIINLIEGVFEALSHISKKSTMSKLLFWSLLAWIFEGFTFLMGALALPVISHSFGAWLALPVGTLSTILPSTPGYIGTFDFFTSRAMVIVGNGVEASTAYALLVHLILWFPPTILGGVYLLLNPILKK